MIRNIENWYKINNFNFYYVGDTADEGSYILKRRIVFMTKDIYEKINSFEVNGNKLKLTLKDESVINVNLIYAGVFEWELNNV